MMSTPFLLLFSFQCYLFIYFIILYWFCHILTWICHGRTCIPHPEHPSHLLPYPIPLGHPSASALSTLYHASNLDWWFVSHMIIYMIQCHSPISPPLRTLPQSPKDCSIRLCLFCCQMATHSSILAWRIPGMGEPHGLLSMGSHRVGHDWVTELNWTECIYIKFRMMVMITLYARQQKRHRCIEQSFGLCGRGRGWDNLGEWHWNSV